MKILYVEDELSKNIPRIIRLFQKYLGEERIRELEAIEHDESGFGGRPEDIKQIVELCNKIEIEYTFSNALRLNKHPTNMLFFRGIIN